jgi:hypothetical protein
MKNLQTSGFITGKKEIWSLWGKMIASGNFLMRKIRFWIKDLTPLRPLSFPSREILSINGVTINGNGIPGMGVRF